jgi:hypothetical protein
MQFPMILYQKGHEKSETKRERERKIESYKEEASRHFKIKLKL